MRFLHRIGRLIIWFLGLGVVTLALLLAGIWFYVLPQLPDVDSLRSFHLQTPLQVFTKDGKLISEFGEQRRIPITIDQVPDTYLQALLAAEDENYHQHYGVDPKALLRAAVRMVQAGGEIQGGGSTITMQVARNYLLTLEQTFSRKVNEILLSFQIEQALDKNQILEMYINKMFMGHRAYGVEAAAQVYYGRPLWQLTLPEQAMLAGLFKAPSRYNPLTNPERAKIRRNWILGRMLKIGHIDDATYQDAINTEVTARFHSLKPETQASYVAEIVRQELFNNFDIDDVYTGGYKVFTTVDSGLQDAAQAAVQQGLLAYDRRHGFRGYTEIVDVELSNREIERKLNRMSKLGPLEPVVVLSIDEIAQTAEVLMRYGEKQTLHLDDAKWMRPKIMVDKLGEAPQSITELVQLGALVYIEPIVDESTDEANEEQAQDVENEGNDLEQLMQVNEDGSLVPVEEKPLRWALSQVPDVQGALVALNPNNGGVIALVGGYEYVHSKFNRATQALRQPGSSFKPFIYSAALSKGYTAASIINDAPVVFNDVSLEGAWRPENYSGKFFGPTRLREGLFKSRNLVSIRILRDIRASTAVKYVSRFGFNKDQLPINLSLALGSASVFPMDVATAYAALANKGYRIYPYFIERIEDREGNLLYQAEPTTVCDNCLLDEEKLVEKNLASVDTGLDVTTIALDEDQSEPLPVAERIMDERVNYIMHTVLQDVIKQGTGRRALALERSDLAGKTGTTNDQKDAWFSGYNHDVVATAWVGFDQPEPLGRKEFGSTAALPIWIDFMKQALQGLPEKERTVPNGLVKVRIDKTTGLLAQSQNNSMFEIFRQENVPTLESTINSSAPSNGEDGSNGLEDGNASIESVF